MCKLVCRGLGGTPTWYIWGVGGRYAEIFFCYATTLRGDPLIAMPLAVVVIHCPVMPLTIQRAAASLIRFLLLAPLPLANYCLQILT